MVMAMTLLHGDIVTDLPANAVAIVVSGGHLANGYVAAILKEDAAGVLPIQIGVLPLVAVQGQIFDFDALHAVAAEDRKQCRCRRLAHLPEILAQSLVKLKAVAGASD